MILGAIATSTILISTYSTFKGDLTAISVSTDYLDLNISFPSVSLCLLRGKNTNLLREHFPMDGSNNVKEVPRKMYMNFIKMVSSYMYHNPHSFIDPAQNVKTKEDYCEDLNSTCGVNITLLRDLYIPKKCDEIIVGVTFMGKNYSCQEIFKTYRTELGLCFIANNLHSVYVNLCLSVKSLFDVICVVFCRNFVGPKLPLNYDAYTPRKKLLLKIYYKEHSISQLGLYVHATSELPFFSTPVFLLKKIDEHFTYHFNVNENL